MAWEKEMITVTFPTQVDLSARQYFFVKRTAGLVVPCTAATDLPLGVLQNKPVGTVAQPAQATVCILGISKISSEAALAMDALIGPSADGQAEAKVAGADATEFVCGRMLSATTAANAIGTASINCINPPNAVTAN